MYVAARRRLRADRSGRRPTTTASYCRIIRLWKIGTIGHDLHVAFPARRPDIAPRKWCRSARPGAPAAKQLFLQLTLQFTHEGRQSGAALALEPFCLQD